MNNLLKSFAVILLCVVIFASCQKSEAPPPAPSHFISNDTIHINPESRLFASLAFATASKELFSRQIEAPAQIVFDPTQLAFVILPFPGRVVNSHVRLGQSVRAGTPLFEVASADFIEVQRDFFQSQSERDLAHRNLERTKQLHENGVASQRDLEEATNEFRIADEEFRNVTAAAKIFHSDPKNMRVGEPLVIRSPIAGEVIDNNVVLGQFFNEEENAVTVANLQTMWIEAHISERDIRFVHIGSTIQLRVNAYPDKVFSATIFQISEMVDEETRMINVRAECENPGNLLKAGMFASVVIPANPQLRIIVPKTAIMQGERQNFVFVRTSETTVVKRYVVVETTVEGRAVISSGLQANEQVVSSGGIYIVSDGAFFIR